MTRASCASDWREVAEEGCQLFGYQYLIILTTILKYLCQYYETKMRLLPTLQYVQLFSNIKLQSQPKTQIMSWPTATKNYLDVNHGTHSTL